MSAITVLHLEDSVLDHELTQSWLKRGDIEFEAERVDTRETFQAALTRRTFDIILADYSLPAFSGAEALDIARAQAPSSCFIFVSGVLGEEVAIEMLQRGATDYVVKRRMERLAPAVKRALSEGQLRQERETAEKKLRESERRYRTLIETLPQLIWTCDPQGHCDFINTRWLDYTGINEEEMLGADWLDHGIHPADQARVRAAWAASVADGEPYSTEYRIRRRDGQFRWFMARGLPIEDGNGKSVKWLGACTDIQNQKEAEQALQRQAEALFRSNSDLQQFAYIASHDLQEPLRTVISYTQLLSRRYGEQLGPEADEFIQFAVDAANRMQKLLQDLLDYSRTSRDAADAHVPVDAEAALELALAGLRSGVEDANAEITHDRLPKVLVNESQLAQVFQNLISNGLKYHRDGERPRVHVSVARSGADCVFSVTDDGIGFEPEHATRIFGIFQRLHGRDIPGTGIGLAICKRIIETHGGRIWAKGESGKGATFYFSLPAVE